MRVLPRVFIATASTFFLAVNPVHSDPLDEKAWNAVWDRLGKVLPASNETNIVHVLETPVPATWVDGFNLTDLQRIAGAIPEEKYVADPSRMSSLLHQVYASLVLDLELPTGTPEQRKQFLEAAKRYSAAQKSYLEVIDKYKTRWDKEKDDLKDMGRPINDAARLRFRGQYGGMFTEVQAELDDAFLEIQKSAPVAQYWVQAIRRMRDEVVGAQSDLRDVYTYEGGMATLQAIKSDCPDESTDKWEQLTFSTSTTSTTTRTGRWNGNGSWGGSFFSIGVGANGNDYKHWASTSNENISLRLCNLAYAPLGPGAWFVPEILKDLDAGRLRIKEGSPFAGKKALGSDGVIPRLVKGAVIARRVTFSATLAETRLNEYRRAVSGSGGLRIGPFKIGGGGSSTKYSREYTSTSGAYVRSTNFDVPVIVAIITEPTSDGQQPAALAIP